MPIKKITKVVLTLSILGSFLIILLSLNDVKPRSAFIKWTGLELPEPASEEKAFLFIHDSDYVNGCFFFRCDLPESDFEKFVTNYSLEILKDYSNVRIRISREEAPDWWREGALIEMPVHFRRIPGDPRFCQITFWSGGRMYFLQDGPFDTGRLMGNEIRIRY